MYLFIYYKKSGEVQYIQIDTQNMSIGRKETCDIYLDETGVSREHAMISIPENGFPVITDLNSKNGSFVNNIRITKRQLRPGDVVRFGNVSLIFTWNHEFFMENQQHLHYQTALLQIDRNLLTEKEYPVLIQGLLDEVFKVIAADRGYLILRNDGKYNVMAYKGANIEEKNTFEKEISSTLIEQCFSSPKSFFISDALSDPRYSHSISIHDLKLRSVLVSPLRYSNDVIGALYLENRSQPNVFTEYDRQFMDKLSEMASLSIMRAWELHEEKRKRKMLETDIFKKYKFPGIITRDPDMVKILETISHIASSNAGILIEGETGTGKELIAKAIHLNSSRADKPFEVLNCGAFNEQLLDSELFGYMKGAFTGAFNDKEGLLAKANGGTLFLDEISDIKFDLQVKLLRLLQSGEYRPLGSNKTEFTDIRFICATHKNLKKLVENGQFRDDLFYRVYCIELKLPPLRERSGDIPILINHFVKICCEQEGFNIKTIDPEIYSLLSNYPFPGNVRELEHLIKSAVIISKNDTVRKDHLPQDILKKLEPCFSPTNIFTKKDLLEAKKQVINNAVSKVEEKFIRDVLSASHGNVSKAAEKAEINRSYFQKLIKKYGLAAKNFRK